MAFSPDAGGSGISPLLKMLSLLGSPRGVSSKRGRLKRPSPSEDAVIARGLDWHYASAGSDFSESFATKRTWVSSKSAPMLKSGAIAAR